MDPNNSTEPQPGPSSGVRAEQDKSGLSAWNMATTDKLQTLAESLDPTELTASHTSVGVYKTLLNKMNKTQDAESINAAVKLLGPMQVVKVEDQDEEMSKAGGDEEPAMALMLNDELGTEDVEAEGERPKSNAASRHSENKKEYLKVLETTVNRLMKERDDMDHIINKMTEVEDKANEEANMYMAMLQYVDNIACDSMSEKEWEEFFNKHFVDGVFRRNGFPPSSELVHTGRGNGEATNAPAVKAIKAEVERAEDRDPTLASDLALD